MMHRQGTNMRWGVGISITNEFSRPWFDQIAVTVCEEPIGHGLRERYPNIGRRVSISRHEVGLNMIFHADGLHARIDMDLVIGLLQSDFFQKKIGPSVSDNSAHIHTVSVLIFLLLCFSFSSL
jgi:hypothetical protein